MCLQASLIYGCKDNKQVNTSADLHKKEISYLTTIDSKFMEADLTKDIDSTTEIYRIWRLCAFQDDTSNVITIENKNGKITISEKKFNQKHSIPISSDSVFQIRKRTLNQTDWRFFKDKIYNSYFWNLTNTADDDEIYDCNTYIFEGARGNNRFTKKYNVFSTQCPQGTLSEIYSCLRGFIN